MAFVINRADFFLCKNAVSPDGETAFCTYCFLLVSLDCARHEHGTENHPLCGWKINGYTNKKITIRFI